MKRLMIIALLPVLMGAGPARLGTPLRNSDGHLTIAGLIAELEKIEDKSQSACASLTITSPVGWQLDSYENPYRLGLVGVSSGVSGGLKFGFTKVPCGKWPARTGLTVTGNMVTDEGKAIKQ